MTQEQYKENLRQLQNDHEEAKKNLAIAYAKANNPYKIGDVVTDHIGSLKIERIAYSFGYDMPCCVYYGVELKKDGTPMKRQEGRGVYQSNILKPATHH